LNALHLHCEQGNCHHHARESAHRQDVAPVLRYLVRLNSKGDDDDADAYTYDYGCHFQFLKCGLLSMGKLPFIHFFILKLRFQTLVEQAGKNKPI